MPTPTRVVNLNQREFLGIILPDKDVRHQGRYKVHIPELQPHMPPSEGIWAKNHVHKWRITPSQNGIYGEYFPLQPGTLVVVKFFDNQLETAYIDRIVSDSHPQSQPNQTVDRDDFYVVIRTPKYQHFFAFCEDTSDKPAQSIHLYFNKQATTIVIDNNGINIKTNANLHITTSGVTNLSAGGDINLKSGATINIQSGSPINIKGGGNINIDGPTINLNCGAAGSAAGAASPTLIDMSAEYEYFKKTEGR